MAHLRVAEDYPSGVTVLNDPAITTVHNCYTCGCAILNLFKRDPEDDDVWPCCERPRIFDDFCRIRAEINWAWLARRWKLVMLAIKVVREHNHIERMYRPGGQGAALAKEEFENACKHFDKSARV